MNAHEERRFLEPPPNFAPLRSRALVVAAIGGGICVLAWLLNPARFVQSYLVAYLFWIGIATACLSVVMLHQLVGGIWGFLVRRPAEAATAAIPWMALLFLPIALGLRYLYPWDDPSKVAADHILQIKVRYLNAGFFLGRSALYLVLWSALAVLYHRWSSRQDETTDPSPTGKLQVLSGPGLVIYFLVVTFAMIDWAMSLEPDWFSSIYGAMRLVGQVLAALAFLIIVAARLKETEPMAEVGTREAFNDLGNLLLAFVMLWAYMSFSQYLITWSGNLADEIPWYLRRSAGGWRSVAVGLIVFHFFVPFFLLLSRERKRGARSLARVCWAILAVRVVDELWLILPAFEAPNVLEFWPVVPAMFGIGGLWMAVFFGRLSARPLVPRNDPQLAAALEHHGD